MNDEELGRQLRAWSSGPSTAPTVAAMRDEPTGAPSRVESDSTDPIDTSGRVTAASRRSSQHRLLARAAIVVLALAIAGASAWLVTGRSTDLSVASTSSEEPSSADEFSAGDCPAPQPRPTGLSDEELAAYRERNRTLADENFEQSLRTGFAKSSAPDSNSDDYVCGWTKVNKADSPSPGLPQLVNGGGQELYDAVDGNLMGYIYPYLGFYTVEEASVPGFDPIALRVAEFGCDPVVDSSCQPTAP